MVFNVGSMELVVVGVVALVVLGPDRLPSAVRSVGSILGQLRRIAHGFQMDLTAEIAEAEAEAESTGAPTTLVDEQPLAPHPLPGRRAV